MHNKFVRIAIAAAVAVLLALWAGSSRQPQETVGVAEPLVPGLAAGINEVSAIKITGAENLVIATLNRSDSGWTIAEKSGHPADVSKIREYLLKLSEAKVIETKTADPANYPKLGVEEISAKDAKGGLIELTGLKEPVRLIIGNFSGRGGEGTFVRRADQPQSLLASGNIALDKVAANWLVKDIADIPSSRVREVRIDSQGKVLRVYKDNASEANYRVADLPKGREAASEFVANGFASVLSGLRFDDVLPVAAAAPGDARLWTSTYAMFDGLAVTATAWEKDGKDYATFVATLDEAVAGTHIEAAQAVERAQFEQIKAENAAAAAAAAEKDPKAEVAPSPEPPLAVADPGKDRDNRLAVLRTEVETLNARFKDWVYVIPAFKFANMNKTQDDMLKPLEGKGK
jgi:hypothetical protein